MKTRATTAVLAHTDAVRAWRNNPCSSTEDDLTQTLEALGRVATELERENIALKTKKRGRVGGS